LEKFCKQYLSVFCHYKFAKKIIKALGQGPKLNLGPRIAKTFTPLKV